MVDAAIFARRLDALEGYLRRLRSLGRTSESDYLADPDVHDLAARYLHLAMEAVLDVANHWIADAGLRTPDTNRDAFTSLEEAGEIAPELAQRLRQWAGFRNVLVQLITIIGLTYASLLEGSVLTETVFAWPGIGQYITSSLFNNDMNAVLGGTIVVGVCFVGINMLSDLLYRLVDPRVR